MKQSSLRTPRVWNWVCTVVGASPARVSASVLAMLVGAVLLGAVVRAYHAEATRDVLRTKLPKASVPTQATRPAKQGELLTRLSFQPEADKLRRRLGLRFLEPGRDQSTMIGSLTIGKQTTLIRIVRTQNDKGERLEIALGVGPASLTWTSAEGARAGSSDASPSERSLIERLALDSPDQFVLAQVRGASYFTVARDATPPRASITDDYAGPVWDLIRVAEPQSGGNSKPISLWRLYHINTTTGLLDKVISQDEGKVVVEAAFSEWVNQDGDWVPSHITWTSGNQTLMELRLTNAAFGPKQ